MLAKVESVLRSGSYFALVLIGFAVAATAQTPDQVLIVVNRQSAISQEIGQYYMKKRGVPLRNLCTINTPPVEKISREIYNSQVEAPIGSCLNNKNLREQILYMLTTYGVPLTISGRQPAGSLQTDTASVDSELTLLYQRLHGAHVPLSGPAPNPFFRQRDAPFRHPQFPMYLVTRLAAYDLAEMRAMVDRALIARNKGKFVIDLKASEPTEGNSDGNQWLRTAGFLLPKDRVVIDETAEVITNQKDVIGYAGWGSNDTARRQRFLHFQWLPGAIATDFVSSNARTFARPPDAWTLGNWNNRTTWFAGTPQSLSADYIHEGATGASGNVDEPFLTYCARPEFVLPAYFSGRTLAESYYMGLPGLSWMSVVIGDPLTRLKP